MKRFTMVFIAVLLLFALSACGNASSSDSLLSDYQYQAHIDNNDDILILAKTQKALEEFILQSTQNEIISAFSDLDESYEIKSNDVVSIEKVEFENGKSADSYSTIYVTARNNSGKSLKLLNLNIDFIDENGDITNSTYPQYGSVLDDGQACRIDALYKGIPYGIRIASASLTTLPDDNYINILFESSFIAINPTMQDVPKSTVDATATPSLAEQAYLEATTLNASDLTKTQRGTYNYRYWNFGEDEISKIGGKTVVNQGAIYNAISWDIANYKDFGAGSSSLFKVVLGAEEKPENANQLIEEISAFVFPDATEKEMLAALESCSCVNGEFDYSARHYEFTISDLRECANELHISEEMLGYILAKLDEYQSEFVFIGNTLSCTINVKTYQSVF